MAKTVKETTKAPTGITITRNNEVLTVTWKIAGRDYGKGQYFQQLINTGKNSSWTPAKNTNIGIMAYSKAVTVKKTSFYPYKGKPILKSVGVRIKGHQKDYTTGSGKKKRKHVMSASGWATKYYTFNPPIRPSISRALDEELTNVCKFSWSVTVANNTTQMFTDVQLQSIFVKNSTERDGSKLNWSKALTEVKGSTGDRTFTEDTAILYKNGDTYTRWVRVRSRGPAGNSAWSYACQVYALPNQANVLNTYAEETEEGGFRCIVDWEVTGNQKNPIDRTMVQYTILTPEEDLTCPSGASWTDANISRDTSYGDAAVFSIDDQLGKDQCLFIRVNTQHDGNITYGKPQLSSVGYLKDPSGLSVLTDDTTHKATIQATNNSEIPDSFLVVRYVPAEGDPIPIGIIPHGEASVTVQCPDWSDQSAIAFDVYAVVGSYEKQPREDGVDSYDIVVRMQSQKTVSQGGQVPVAPQQVSVHRVEGKPDTVRVSWDWPWSEAGSAEIAWSDHDDAWESTDEPETYMISNLHASHWNISGLETGRTWYIRVRLIKGSIDNSEDVTYGPWSDINQGTIDLSSAPNKPTLILSDPVIPGDGVTTASWVYTTTDSTYQTYGEVAIVEGEEYTPIAHALTEQHVTIDATQVGLEVGNVYNLSCRVRSASGRVSEWSDTVSVAIAEPLVCEITETSLEPDVVEVNPRSFGPGANVPFNTTIEETTTKLKVNMEPIQDLHGYDHPWVGGAGKNKLNLTSISPQKVENGITFTVNADGTIKANGTATAQSQIYWPIPKAIAQTFGGMILNGCVTGGSIILEAAGAPYTLYATDRGSGAIISESIASMPTANVNLIFRVSNGTTLNNVTIKPMIRLSSVSDDTFAPYSNICPISGYDSVSASVSQRNLFSGEYMEMYRLPYPIPKRIWVTASAKTSGATQIYYYDENGEQIDYFTLNVTDPNDPSRRYRTFQISQYGSMAVPYYIMFKNYTATEMQFEIAESASSLPSPYEAPTTYTTDLNQTVYGGTLDLVTGVLTVDRKMITLDGVTSGKRFNGVFGATNNGYAAYWSEAIPRDYSAISNRFVAYQFGVDSMPLGSFVGGSGVITTWTFILPSSITSKDEANAWLAENPTTIVYELAQPQTYQLTPYQIQTLVGQNNVWSDAGSVEVRIAEAMRDTIALKEMPFSLTVTGAGEGGLTSVSIERSEDYTLDRPDEDKFQGHKGEVVLQTSPPIVGEGQIVFYVEDLLGSLDDGASYLIRAIVQDGLGQRAEAVLGFEVHWRDQAVEPSAEITLDQEELIAFIKPLAVEGMLPTDVADIYRLSADKPKLIVRGATFGETYVDPFPALGDMGGHRIVTRTKNGDYITEDNRLAMVDSPELEVNPLDNEELLNIIDFDGRQILFYWDSNYSNTWTKDFQRTRYLGGSDQGDWNEGIERTGSLTSRAITVLDKEMVKDVRRLAEYSGLCHVRTADGSSYSADVQVSDDYVDDDQGMVVNYSLSITRVDEQELDGMTLDQWNAENPEEEGEE